MAIIFSKTNILTRLIHIKGLNNNRLLSLSVLNRCKMNEVEHDDEKPIRYSTSKAAKWKAEVTRSGDINPSPWFQPYVILCSLSVFMIYFFVLREESDIDTEFDKTLYDRISGLEEKQLELVLEYNLNNNLPVKDIKDRLAEIKRKQT